MIFNSQYIPVFLKNHPGKNRRSAGIACGMLHTICKGIDVGDIIISPSKTITPNEDMKFFVGRISGDYCFEDNSELRHRRPIEWETRTIQRSEMSEALWRSIRGPATAVRIEKHADELDRLIGLNVGNPPIVSTDDTIEDTSLFAMEKHLEDFLVENWDATSLAEDYEIFSDEDSTGQQYPTATGPIDILAQRKDGSELLVIELKKGRASDVVVGQILRYMGYVMEEIADHDQTVRGCIIAYDDDPKIRYALQANPLIDFFRYEVSFKLNASAS
ncbi:MAG: endonuclease NucS domain-containing protein [Parvibaculales bacterium]